MPVVPDAVKTEITEQATTLINTVLAPTHLYPRPKDWRWSYPVALYTKWWRHYWSYPGLVDSERLRDAVEDCPSPFVCCG